MNLFVDIKAWYLALRRDSPAGVPEVTCLRDAPFGDKGLYEQA